jgi:hypothetical protein
MGRFYQNSYKDIGTRGGECGQKYTDIKIYVKSTKLYPFILLIYDLFINFNNSFNHTASSRKITHV